MGRLLLILFIIYVVYCVVVTTWRYAFPYRCEHGIPIRPGKPHRCPDCQRAEEKLEADRQRRAAEAKRELERLRAEETENIRQLGYLQEMDPIEFETVVSHAYRNLGWEVENTPASGDRGVDAYLRRGGQTVILQCKRYSSSRVGAPALRDPSGLR